MSLWGGGRVLMFDAKTLAAKGEVVVGEHPNAMALSADGDRLYVACADTNTVAIHVQAKKATEQIPIALFPKAPPGSTPNALSLSPDGKRLAVANADNNTVALGRYSRRQDSSRTSLSCPRVVSDRRLVQPRWQTAVRVEREGLTSAGESARAAAAVCRMRRRPVPGAMLKARFHSRVPDDAALEKNTQTVFDLTPYTDETRLAQAARPAASPFPRAWARRRRSSTCSTSSARTERTTRCSAISIAATAIRSSRCLARPSRPTRTPSRATS